MSSNDLKKSAARLLLAATGLAAGLAPAAAMAGTSRAYVVSWFYIATHSEEGDCKGGLNPPAEKMFARILREQNKPAAEIEKLLEGFPFTMAGPLVAQRGVIDGKPVNVYVNPTSVPDPKINTANGKIGYGFDLDGKTSTGGFTDPVTGEKGVDNQIARVLGCYTAFRALPPARPSFSSIQWDTTRDQMPAWVIEITGIDDEKNDGDVDVGIYRAFEPITRNAAGEPQADLTYRIDPDPRSQNKAHGKIKDGVLTTDAFNFFMVGDPFAMPEYEIKKTHLRLALKEDGTANGVLGGYQPWEPIYFSYALSGPGFEAGLSLDTPGIYYALRNLADASPDPKTGQNMAISIAFNMEVIPAYVEHPTPTVPATAAVPAPARVASKE